MNLQVVYEIINTLYNAGVSEIILEKKDSGVFIRGSDKDTSVVVLSHMDGDIIENTMGIHKVSTLIDRMKLFDLDIAKNKVSTTDEYIKSLTINDGPKRVSFTCANPKHIKIPSGNVSEEISNHVTLSKEQVADICKAINALSPEHVSMVGEDENIFLKLVDGVSDSFQDRLGTNQTGSWSNHWNAVRFVRLLKLAIKSDEEVVLGIGEFGILYIEIEGITFMLRPQAV